MRRELLLVLAGGILLGSLLGSAWIVSGGGINPSSVLSDEEAAQASNTPALQQDAIDDFDYADVSSELTAISNVSFEETPDGEADTAVEDVDIPDETREAAVSGAEDGISLAADRGANVTAEREQAAIDGAIRAAAENEEATPGSIRAAARGASHGTLLQSREGASSEEIDVERIRASVYGSAAGALSQRQDATVRQLQSAAYGAAHGTTAQHQQANVTQMQHAAVGAAAGATHGAVRTRQSDVTQIQEAAQGGSYGALTQRQTVTATQIQAAAFGAAGGAAERSDDRKQDPKKVQEASMGAAKGSLVQRQRASVEQVQAAARGACKGALVQSQNQNVTVTQIQQAASGAAQGAISQHQVASVRQIQAAALGGASGILQQTQRVDIIQIQHAAAGAARGAAGAAAQYQITNVEQIQAAAAGAGHGSVIQIQQVNVRQVQVIAEGAARGALSQHQRASVVQIQSAARGASEGTLSLTQIQLVTIQQIQIISERAAAETVRTAVDVDVDVEKTIYKYAKGAGKETDRDRDPRLRSLFFDVDDETLFLANPNEFAVTVTVTDDDGDFETITLSAGESLTREFDRGVYTLTAESEDGRTVKIAGRKEVTVNLGPDLQGLTATVEDRTLRVENPNDSPAIVTIREDGERILTFAVPSTSERAHNLDPGEYTLTARIGEQRVPINGEERYEVRIEAREIYLDVTVDERDLVIENPSETNATVTVRNDETGDEQEIAVPGETTRNRTLEPGDYTLTAEAEEADIFLNGEEELSISIAQPTARFLVEIVDVTDPVEAGESLSVTANISNDGDTAGEEEIALDIDDREGLDRTTVALDPGETETVTLTYRTTEDDVGERDVTVRSSGDSVTETVEVRDVDDDGADARVLDSCTAITESGAYELADDIDGEAASVVDESNACVRVNASDVVLEGNDNAIRGTGEGETGGEEETIGLLVAGTEETVAENVTIQNLRAEGWNRGIQVGTSISVIGTTRDPDEARLEDVTASENVNHGIYISEYGSVNIETAEATRNGENGIYVRDGDVDSILDTDASGNGLQGIHISEGAVGSMVNVTATGNGRDGLDIGEISDVTLEGITANDNDGNGIDIGETSGVFAEGLTVTENDRFGIALGADVYRSEFTAVAASENAAGGVVLSGDASRNVLRDATIDDNGGPGIRYVESHSNEFRNVTLRDNDGWQLDAYDDETFSASELWIGETAEFAFEDEVVSLDDVPREEFPPFPENAEPIGDGVEIEGIQNSVNVALEYDEDASEDDGQIELWRYDGQEWVTVETVDDEADGAIDAILTEDGLYAPVLLEEDEGIDLNVTVTQGTVTIENPTATAASVIATEDETGEERLVEVAAGETVTETFESGDYTLSGEAEDGRPVTLNGEAELAITISAPDPAEFVIESVETNDPIEAGEELEVTAQIENVGEETATQEISLDVGGQEDVDTEDLELEGGESESVELTYQTDGDDVGDLEVTVSTADATETVVATVQEPPEEETEEEPVTEDSDESESDEDDSESADGSDEEEQQTEDGSETEEETQEDSEGGELEENSSDEQGSAGE